MSSLAATMEAQAKNAQSAKDLEEIFLQMNKEFNAVRSILEQEI